MRILTIFLTFFLLFSLVFSAQPAGPSKQELELLNDVLGAPYNTSDYTENEFDCSNMAALLSDYLDQNGWNATIVAQNGRSYGHAWVDVGEYHIEATTKSFFAEGPNLVKYLPQRWYFDNSTEAKAISSQEEGWTEEIVEREWGYDSYLSQKT